MSESSEGDPPPQPLDDLYSIWKEELSVLDFAAVKAHVQELLEHPHVVSCRSAPTEAFAAATYRHELRLQKRRRGVR